MHHWNAQLLIVQHLVALVVHRAKGERLVGAMLTGRRRLPGRPADGVDEGVDPAGGTPWLAAC